MKRALLFFFVLVIIAGTVSAAAEGEAEEFDLSVGTHWVGANTRAAPMERAYERFMAANPNVTITIQPMAGDGGDTSLAWLAAGDVPDIFEFGGQFLARFYEAGLLMDLTGEMEADPAWRNRFLPGILESKIIDGKILTLPASFYYVTFYANKELFAAEGLDLPETWDDLLAAQRVFNQNPDVEGYFPFGTWPVSATFLALVASNGAADVYREAALEYAGSWDHPGIRDSLEQLKALYDLVQDNPNETSFDSSHSFFTTGKSALYLNGTWAIAQFAEGPLSEAFVDNLAAIPVPHVGIPNTMANGVDHGWSAAADATGAKADAAVALLKEICSLETTQDTLYTAQSLNGLDPGDYDRSRIGLLADVLDILPGMPPASVDLNVWPSVPDPSTLTDTLAAMVEYLDGKMTLDETIVRLDEITLKN